MKKIKVLITGKTGLVGSSLHRIFKLKKKYKILKYERKKLDLLNQQHVNKFLKTNKPDLIIHAAGKVGGIMNNKLNPANFIYENSQMALNIIHYGYKYNVKKIINLGSACIYPKFSKQPIKEKYLLTGKLETTNEAYAVAKILGLKLTEFYQKQYGSNFLSLQPTNLYGVNDNFDPHGGHVIPAMINKFHNAKIYKKKEVTLWGTGKPKREFLYVDDLAESILFIIEKKISRNLINIGSGEEVTIKELAYIIKKITKYKGNIFFDKSKPDGTPRKYLDNSVMKKMGWKPKTSLLNGIKKTYRFYLKKNKQK